MLHESELLIYIEGRCDRRIVWMDLIHLEYLFYAMSRQCFKSIIPNLHFLRTRGCRQLMDMQCCNTTCS